MEDRSTPIITEQSFKVSCKELWKAITDRDTMVKWYFDNIDTFEPVIGSKSRFPVASGDRTFTHLWTVTEVIPNQRIAYSWSFEEYPGISHVIFEVSEREGGSHLRHTNIGLHTFPDDIDEFQRASCVGGWHYFINERLKDFLDSPAD